MGDLHEVIAACADFDHVLKTFVERVKTPGDAVEHARKLQEGVGLFQFLLEAMATVRIEVEFAHFACCSCGESGVPLGPLDWDAAAWWNTLRCKECLLNLGYQVVRKTSVRTWRPNRNQGRPLDMKKRIVLS
ncbi:unnamed protein product [Durusdinium trenchii]|uniref:Uncharacterized protein n=1 Tax=Durusdinium trenchii TaxID=1381693 RepID=A0ABP0I1C9_9DINO